MFIKWFASINRFLILIPILTVYYLNSLAIKYLLASAIRKSGDLRYILI